MSTVEDCYWVCVACEVLNRSVPGAISCFECGADANLGRIVMRKDFEDRVRRWEKAKAEAEQANLEAAAKLDAIRAVARIEGELRKAQEIITNQRVRIVHLEAELNVTRTNLRRAKRQLTPVPGIRGEWRAFRDAEICRRAAAGESKAKLAHEHNLSDGRIYQIVQREKRRARRVTRCS